MNPVQKNYRFEKRILDNYKRYKSNTLTPKQQQLVNHHIDKYNDYKINKHYPLGPPSNLTE